MLYFTQTIPRPAIWGGTSLRRYFHFPENYGDNIGQCWAFSAQENGATPVRDQTGAVSDLSILWNKHPELFKSKWKQFPFIISLVAPEDDLSIQVHPGTEYARHLGYPCGKNEAWVFLQVPETGSIIYGHNAQDEKDLRQYISSQRWQDLVRHLAIEKDDAVYIPSGTLHALTKGSVVYEIQQSTDITYRFYDYDRQDAAGNRRPLQLEEAISCLRYDLDESIAHSQIISMPLDHGTEEILIRNDSFVVRRFDCRDACTLHYKGYLLATVTDGEGFVNNQPVHIGCSFLIPAGETVHVRGQIKLLTTSEE